MHSTTRQLLGKKALVIGGGTAGEGVGIGRAVALLMASEGAVVAIGDNDFSSAKKTVDQIEASGGEALALEMDVTNDNSIRSGIKEATHSIGEIDILHNNVGMGKSGPPEETSADEWRRIQDANVTALHVSAQAVLPSMIDRGEGVMLVTGSIAGLGHVGYPHLAYSVTKAAAMHFVRMMAVEYGQHGIRSNAVIAGLIDTPRIQNTVKAAYEAKGITNWKEARGRVVPMRRMGKSEEVADAAVFLCSDRASYVNGACLIVDGGLSAAFPS